MTVTLENVNQAFAPSIRQALENSELVLGFPVRVGKDNSSPEREIIISILEENSGGREVKNLGDLRGLTPDKFRQLYAAADAANTIFVIHGLFDMTFDNINAHDSRDIMETAINNSKVALTVSFQSLL